MPGHEALFSLHAALDAGIVAIAWLLGGIGFKTAIRVRRFIVRCDVGRRARSAADISRFTQRFLEHIFVLSLRVPVRIGGDKTDVSPDTSTASARPACARHHSSTPAACSQVVSYGPNYSDG